MLAMEQVILDPKVYKWKRGADGIRHFWPVVTRKGVKRAWAERAEGANIQRDLI